MLARGITLLGLLAAGFAVGSVGKSPEPAPVAIEQPTPAVGQPQPLVAPEAPQKRPEAAPVVVPVSAPVVKSASCCNGDCCQCAGKSPYWFNEHTRTYVKGWMLTPEEVERRNAVERNLRRSNPEPVRVLPTYPVEPPPARKTVEPFSQQSYYSVPMQVQPPVVNYRTVPMQQGNCVGGNCAVPYSNTRTGLFGRRR